MKIVLVALVFVPTMVYADDNRGFIIADNLGWLAIGCGISANLSLVIFKMVRKIPVMKLVGSSGTSQSLTSVYKPVLNFHIMLNSVGFFIRFIAWIYAPPRTGLYHTFIDHSHDCFND
ncbi:MAG: hypothetical protein ACREAR_05490 [Nitrosotalea sp.]